MALYNLARMTTATTGTGTITLAAAVSGYLSFASAGVTDGATVTYAIKDGANSEIGRGVYTSSGTTLTRTVLKSTNSNSAINLSGSAEVFITAAAEDLREKLAAATTFYIRDDGSDSNDGRADNSSGAFLTLQGAFNAIVSRFDFGGQAVTMQTRKAADTAGISFNSDWVGGGSITLQGDTTTPANTPISRTSGNSPIRLTAPYSGQITIRGLKLSCTHAAPLISHEGVGIVIVNTLDLAGQQTSGAFAGMLSAVRPMAHLRINGAITVSGSGSCFAQAGTGGYVEFFAGPTVTLTGTPNFSWATMVAAQRSFIYTAGVTFSGSATGTRYSVSDLAEIYANGVTIPGDVAGSVGTAGFYV